MDKNLLLLILAIAAVVTIAGVGSLLAQPKDNYYDYVASAPSEINFGEPLSIIVKLAEKGRILADCDKNGMGNRISPDTAHYCASYTYFNARSIRINIDGQELVDFYSYPMGTSGTSVVSPLPQVGPVSCFGAIGACSVTSNQDRSGQQFHRAYFFGKRIAPQTSIDGQILFDFTLPYQYLKPGNRTVEIYYFAETTSRASDNTVTPEYYTRLGGQQYGDQNQKYNYYERFTVDVIPPAGSTVYVQNETKIAELQAQIDSLNIILAQTQIQLALAQNNLASAQAALASTNSSLNSAQSVISTLNQQIADLKELIVSTQSDLAAAKASLQAVQLSYNDASAKLEAVTAAQADTQAKLASALSDLGSARDANVRYRISVDNLAAELQATKLLTAQQDATITQLRGYALTKEQIANQSIALAAQKEAQAQAALSEVYRVMQEKSAADALFQAQMQITLAKLDSTSASLSEKVAALNDQKALLDRAYSDVQAAQTQLAEANAAISERQAALAQAQLAIAELQKANADLKAQLGGGGMDSLLILIVVAAGAIIGWKVILKK